MLNRHQNGLKLNKALHRLSIQEPRELTSRETSNNFKKGVLSHSYADLRLKLGQHKEEPELIPSEISQDEWAEIAKYNQEKDAEAKIVAQQEYLRKKRHIKTILDKQMQERIK